MGRGAALLRPYIPMWLKFDHLREKRLLSNKRMDILEQRIKTWADTRPEIRLVLVVGSRARKSPPADKWADLDLHLFCTDSEQLTRDMGWLESIGEVWLCLRTQLDERIPQRLVLFEGGKKVDLAFFPLQFARDFVAVGQLDETHDRGYYPLLDKDGLAAKLPHPLRQPHRREIPPEDEFLQVINTFFYGAVYVAKQIRRGNLWVAKFRGWTMKQQLLCMMEWYALALHGHEYDTFYDGHFLFEWSDPQTWDELQKTFGGFNASECWRALFGTMELFQRLSTIVAFTWGYPYPAALDKRITAYVKSLHAETAQEAAH
jgi:aminoglycoside 6-adenylyltransferase